ncbi:hypothetical protein DBR33_11375, partial [Stenotrophomonas sp. HMWF022]
MDFATRCTRSPFVLNSSSLPDIDPM